MKTRKAHLFEFLAITILFAVFVYPSIKTQEAKGDTATHTAVIGNATPEISALKLNNNNPITLTAGTTTLVYVSFTVSDNNGCSDVFTSGGVTTTIYRTDQGTSCSFNYQNCYIESTTTYSCVGTSTSAQATTTFSIYYFADATDASSSASSTNWTAYVIARDASSTTGSATSTAVELNTLTAISLSSSTMSYGTVGAGSNTSSTNQATDVFNAGNSSSTLQISGTAMSNGSVTIPTSSQHYATSSFTFGGTEQFLSDVAATVSGWVTSKAGNLRWSTSSMHQIRANHSGATNGEYIYISGGEDASYVPTTTVKFVKPDASGTLTDWQNGTALPQARITHGSAIANGFIYIAGGWSGSGSTSSVIFAPINATGSIGAWSSTVALPTSDTQDMTLVSSGNYIYALGFTEGGSGTTTIYYSSSTISGQLNSWATTTPLPAPLNGPAAITRNNKIYIGGGVDSSYGQNSGTSTLFATISPNGSIGAWSSTSPYANIYSAMGIASYRFAVSNDIIYGIGYYTGSTQKYVYYSTFQPDGTLGRWTRGTDLPVQVRADAVLSLKGYIYSLSGYASEYVVYRSKLPSQNTYWGVGVPAGTLQATGLTSTITYTAQFSQ